MTAGIAAIGGSNLQIVVVVDMAGRARNIGVAVGQEKTGGAVIEDGGGPTDGVVAGGAVGSGESGASRGVRRIVGLLPLSEVAILAGAGGEVVIVVYVASGAGQIGVAVGEQETSSAVIEFGAEPTVKTMAAWRIDWKRRRDRRWREEDWWCSASPSGGRSRSECRGRGIGRRQHSCGKNRKEQRREPREAGNDSGDL